MAADRNELVLKKTKKTFTPTFPNTDSRCVDCSHERTEHKADRIEVMLGQVWTFMTGNKCQIVSSWLVHMTTYNAPSRIPILGGERVQINKKLQKSFVIGMKRISTIHFASLVKVPALRLCLIWERRAKVNCKEADNCKPRSPTSPLNQFRVWNKTKKKSQHLYVVATLQTMRYTLCLHLTLVCPVKWMWSLFASVHERIS